MIEWSKRAGEYIDMSDVLGIEVLYDPVSDPEPSSECPNLIFDWTILFTMNDGRSIKHGWYGEEDEVKHDAYLYAKQCWETNN